MVSTCNFRRLLHETFEIEYGWIFERSELERRGRYRTALSRLDAGRISLMLPPLVSR